MFVPLSLYYIAFCNCKFLPNWNMLECLPLLVTSTLMYYLKARQELTWVEPPPNIRLECKCLTFSKTLAYWYMSKLTTVKSFIILTSGESYSRSSQQYMFENFWWYLKLGMIIMFLIPTRQGDTGLWVGYLDCLLAKNNLSEIKALAYYAI